MGERVTFPSSTGPLSAVIEVPEGAVRGWGVFAHPRSFVSLEGSDHLLTKRGQAHRAGRIIGARADAYPGDP
jgi:hypothetical protein